MSMDRAAGLAGEEKTQGTVYSVDVGMYSFRHFAERLLGLKPSRDESSGEIRLERSPGRPTCC
jgi:hypothetical protein